MNRNPELTMEVREGVVCVRDASPRNSLKLSLTNAAEHVAEEAFRRLGNLPVVYLDSEGVWDEIAHEKGRFLGFRRVAERDLDEAVRLVNMRRSDYGMRG